MQKISSFFRLAQKSSLKKMFEKIDEVHKISGLLKPVIFLDMIRCALFYQAGYMDYALFAMYRLTGRQRKTVLTRGIGNQYVAALNHTEDRPLFERKDLFFKTFPQFIRRRYLSLEQASFDEFCAFSSSLSSFVAKPLDGTHGSRVERFDVSADTDLKALYDQLLQNGQTLIEEVIPQHGDLNTLYSGSINTVRLVTLLWDGTAHVIAASLRLGNEGRFIDNFSGGGMVACADRDSGVITSPAVNGAGQIFEVHPESGARLPGAVIPLFAECLTLVKAAALVVPTVGYVAWDVAVTPAGPLLVEGNSFPGHVLYSLPGHSKDNIGILPALEAVIPRKSLKKLIKRRPWK